MRNYPKILAFLAFVLVAGCNRTPRPAPWYVGSLRIAETTLDENPSLGVDVAGLRQALLEAFVGSRRFVALAEGRMPPGGATPLQCKLEVVFTREALTEESEDVVKAEVGVAMELWRPGEPERFKATGMGRSTFPLIQPSDRTPAFRRALAQALAQVLEAQQYQLASREKSDAELIEDLGSKDPRVRDYAVQALADRRTTDAVPQLIARLSDPDREVALRAVGALGSIGDQRAVAPLIEITRNRDTQFLLTVVEVVASIGGPDAEGFLFTLDSGHPEELVRQAAREANERLQARKSAPPPGKLPVFQETP